MAGILSDSKFGQLVGLPEARKQMRELPDVARRVHFRASTETAEAVLLRAKSAVPVRRKELPDGYGGGALKQHLAMKAIPKTAEAIVGIEKVALVVRNRGRRGASTTTYADHKFKRAHDGKWRRRAVAKRYAERLRAGGARIIRPTKYGHLQEFGAPQHAARPYLRPAVKAEQAAFEQRHRAAMAEVARLLGEAGYRG